MSHTRSLLKNAVCRWLAGMSMALACAGNAQALGMNLPYQSFATAPDVDWIKVCGQWPVPASPSASVPAAVQAGSHSQEVQTNDGAGMYRIVHASRYGQSFLYLQWIVRDGSDSAAEVHTEGFADLNNDHAEITLSQMRCQPTRQGIRFTARAQSGNDNNVFRITIDAGHQPGELRYRTSKRR